MKLDQAAWIHALQMTLIFIAVMTVVLVMQNPLAMFGLLLIWSSPPVFIPKSEPDRDEEQEESSGIGFLSNIE
jgi:hypothetical protein